MSLLDPPDKIRSADDNIGLADFYAVPESHQFLYMPTRGLWPAASVDSILPAIPMPYKVNGKFVRLKPSVWLKRHRRVEQMTWVPGFPEIIEDRLISEGGWKDHAGAHAVNLYQPPQIVHGDAAQATPWIEHLKRLYPEDADDVINWFAHRVQRPGEKINFALVMGGGQGIGKDWLLQALKMILGAWNFQEISPTDLMTPYNPFAKAVVLRMNEAHDLGEGGRADRYALYERVKIYAAAPPDVLPCVDKYIRRFYVPNIVGLVITTNHKADGLHLEGDDRRYLVVWSECTKEEFAKEYWNEHWRWLLHEGGVGHVAAYLAQHDLSTFDPCAPPRQTAAFYQIVNANQAPEDAELADALDELEWPRICSLAMIVATERGSAMEWILDRRSRRAMPYRMERQGYVACRNPNAKNGLWSINKRRQTLYAQARLKEEEQQQAARDHCLKWEKTTGSS